MARSTRQVKPAAQQPPVALGGEVVRERGLRWPLVAYPGHYGIFHTYSRVDGEPWRFCLCARKALANHVWLVSQGAMRTQPQQWLAHVGVPANHLPDPEFWKRLSDDDLYAENLCHACAGITPTLRWTHEMYETQFNQFHGWYTAQERARAGFAKYSQLATPDADPELVDLMLRSTPTAQQPNPSASPAERTRWRRVFQDRARERFGYRKVGDGAVSETQLAGLIAAILGYEREEIVRHHRPKWLQGLELDIFVSELSLGVEYQGEQHYKAVEFWGGQEAFEALQQRDAKKKRLCAENGIVLLEVLHDEPLTREHITARLAEHLPAHAFDKAKPKSTRPTRFLEFLDQDNDDRYPPLTTYPVPVAGFIYPSRFTDPKDGPLACILQVSETDAKFQHGTREHLVAWALSMGAELLWDLVEDEWVRTSLA